MKVSIGSQVAQLLLVFSASFCQAQIPGYLENLFKARGKEISVGVKDCYGSKCKLDMFALDVDGDADSIKFDFKGNGHKINCKKPERGNRLTGSIDSWFGHCDGGGTANFISSRTNSRGEKLWFGFVVDVTTQEVCQVKPDADRNIGVNCIPLADFPGYSEAPEIRGDYEVIPDDGESPGEQEKPPVPDGSIPFPDEFGSRKLVQDDINDESIPEVTKKPRVSVNKENYGLKGSVPPFTLDKGHRNLQNDSGEVQDIMVVWTNSAECANANLGSGCAKTAATKADMLDTITLAISAANTAYSNSGIQTELRLVHAYRDENYVEPSGGSGFSQALNDITYTTDSHFVDVHSKREKYGADIIALLINNSACKYSSCGANAVS